MRSRRTSMVLASFGSALVVAAVLTFVVIRWGPHTDVSASPIPDRSTPGPQPTEPLSTGSTPSATLTTKPTTTTTNDHETDDETNHHTVERGRLAARVLGRVHRIVTEHE